MANENHSNINWKNKLEDTTLLPGDTLTDKNATWKLLQSRLHEKPRYKKAVWFWAAAACLLLAIFIPVMLRYKGKDTSPGTIATKRELMKQQSAEKQLPKAQVDLTVRSTEKKRRIKPVTASSNNKSINVNKETPAIADPQLTNNKITLNPLLPDSSAVITIAVANPKKILKVVHINELGDPVEELQEARTVEQHTFQLKLANQEVFANTPIAYNKTRFSILKTKSSPTN